MNWVDSTCWTNWATQIDSGLDEEQASHGWTKYDNPVRLTRLA